MFQGTELKHQNSQSHLVRKTMIFGETVDKREEPTQFFGNERNGIGVENFGKTSYRTMTDV